MRSLRLPGDLATDVDRLAAQEQRPFTTMIIELVRTGLAVRNRLPCPSCGTPASKQPRRR